VIVASLTLKNISKSFGKVTVLREVNIHVEDGTFCVLLGPSGCGKSTLLNIIAGLTPQDSGNVLLDGEPVDHLAPRERDVAMVFQSYALYPHMTVAQNLGFGLRMRGVGRGEMEQKVHEVARLLGIEELLKRKPRELSGGQRQRVAMGRALVRQPKLFLFDEPLSNLDARLRANVRLELKEIHQQLRGTVVYVTHDQVEAMTLGDHIVVLHEGSVRQEGSPEAIYSRPADRFVAAFLGTPEMNLYSGRVTIGEGQALFNAKGFSLDLGDVLQKLANEEIEIGIRPEDVRINSVEGIGLQAEVEMVSNIGPEIYAHARIGTERITVKAPKDAPLKAGQRLSLGISPHVVHLFHKGRRL
jgi:sn-glycerol 3-phosphate transport system ATP-binding protein